MSIEIRSIEAGEVVAFGDAMGDVFGFELKDERQEWFARSVARARTIAVFDEGQIVATGGAYPLDVTVPGGASLPTGGTTMITVRATHRRRGLLRRMMEFHLDDVAEHEEPIAALWASESSIYSRFGYGVAAYQNTLKIDRHRVALATAVDVPGSIRLVAKDDVVPALVSVYDRVVGTRPGLIARSEDWWRDEHLQDFEDWRNGKTALKFAVYYEDGEPVGYVSYRLKTEWDGGGPKGTVHVVEMMATSEAVTLALWEFIFGIDLMARVEAWNRPVDDTLRWHLIDPRRLTAEVSDSLWVRLMDVPAALSARAFQAPGRLVIEVHDEFRASAGGRFEVDGGPDGAVCKPTGAEPDLVMSAADLGALYLGGNSARQLSRVGRIDGDDAAIATADAMFRWDPAPWCPEVF